MRNNKYRILQNIIQGKVDGRRGSGRRRTSWLDNLRKWFGATSTELFRCAANKIRIAIDDSQRPQSDRAIEEEEENNCDQLSNYVTSA